MYILPIADPLVVKKFTSTLNPSSPSKTPYKKFTIPAPSFTLYRAGKKPILAPEVKVMLINQ